MTDIQHVKLDELLAEVKETQFLLDKVRPTRRIEPPDAQSSRHLVSGISRERLGELTPLSRSTVASLPQFGAEMGA